MLDIVQDVLTDSVPMLPVLFIAYLLIEYFEHRSSHSEASNGLLEKYGPLFGAVVGIIPQCGFSIVAATLFIESKITIGTLISVFIATSDEAIPILFANPEMYTVVMQIILIKIIVAIVVGYFVDIVFIKYRKYKGTYRMREQHEGHTSVFRAAVIRTSKIFAFILLVNLALTTLISILGEENLARVLLTGSFFQPLAAAIFGFIPNCAASVALTQLYASQILSFGALMAGLITNAGLGLVVLMNNRIERKTLAFICMILFISAIITGGVSNFF